MSNKIRKSAALFLFGEGTRPSESNLLMIKRRSKMSFGNLYVAPGGVCDPQDKKFAKADQFSEYGKITSLRQFLEETGILVYPSSFDIQRISKHQSIEQICSKIGYIWKDKLHLILPIIRLMTPQFEKTKRYDCFFFTAQLSEAVKSLNLNAMKKTKEQNFSNFINNFSVEINQAQSSKFIWDSPTNILKQNKADPKHFGLAPPQIILLTSFLRIPNLSLVKKLYPHCLEPIQFRWISQQNCIHLALYGDKDYNSRQLLQNEDDCESKEDFEKYLLERESENKQETNQEVRRIVIPEFKLWSSQKEETILRYLPSFSPSAKL